MSAESAKPKKPKREPMSKRNKILLIILALAMMTVFRTGFLFIIIGLLPSIVTYFMDVMPRRYVFRTIFACNLSGMMPYLVKMLEHGPRSAIMQEIMGSAHNWFIIYGAAMIGWLLVRLAPMIALAFINTFNSTQVMRLKSTQRRIEGEWGKEVTMFSSKPEDTDEEDDLWPGLGTPGRD